jgi:hypothetical protein
MVRAVRYELFLIVGTGQARIGGMTRSAGTTPRVSTSESCGVHRKAQGSIQYQDSRAWLYWANTESHNLVVRTFQLARCYAKVSDWRAVQYQYQNNQVLLVGR